MIPLRDDNPVTNTPIVTYGLVVSCALVFGYQLTLDPNASQAFVYSLGVIPAVLFDQVSLQPSLVLVPPVATIFTSMFLHGGIMHLLGNLLYLWIFADNVEDELGSGRFVAFYLVCGVAAALAQSLLEPRSQVPMIGASGAISGVLGAYLVMHPHARVTGVVPPFLHPVRLPAMVVLGLWFVLQLISSMDTDTVLHLLSHTITELMPEATGCCIHFQLDGTEELLPVVLDGEQGQKQVYPRVGIEALVKQVLAESRTLYISDILANGYNLQPQISSLRTLLMTTLDDGQQRLGTLSVFNPKPDAFEQNHRYIMSILATQAAVTISKARFFEERDRHKEREKYFLQSSITGYLGYLRSPNR